MTCVRSLEHSSGGAGEGFRDGLFPFCVHLLDGVLVSGGGPDKDVKLWSLERGGECIATFVHGATVRGTATSPLGFVASAGGKHKKMIVWGPAPAW